MPIYEYECLKCGHQLEVMQKMSDEPLKQCPKCKAKKLEKIISQSAFAFKGSGWYVTDYSKSGAKKNDSNADKSETSETKAETKADGKTDKTETKAETKTDKAETKAETKKTESKTETTAAGKA